MVRAATFSVRVMDHPAMVAFRDGVQDRIAALEAEVADYRRALVAHHNIANLSEDVVREGLGSPDGCPVCKQAKEA